MIRALVALLVLAFGLVPPGICSCRLEALMFAEPPDHDPCSNDSDDHDGDCLRIQQDCVTSPTPSLASPLLCCALALCPEAPPAEPGHGSVWVVPFHWSDDSPLYLTLRALLL